MIHVPLNGGDRFTNVAEIVAPDVIAREVVKPTLHQVQPRTRFEGLMQMETRMSLQPGLYARVLVGSIVVHDQMQIEIGAVSRSVFLRNRVKS